MFWFSLTFIIFWTSWNYFQIYLTELLNLPNFTDHPILYQTFHGVITTATLDNFFSNFIYIYHYIKYLFYLQGSLISFRLYKSTSWWTISWNLTYRQRHWKISAEGKTFFDHPRFDKYFHSWKQPHCHAYNCVHKFWNHAVKSSFSPRISNLSLFAIIRP